MRVNYNLKVKSQLWIAFDGEIEESPKGKAKLKDNASEMAIQYFFREQASLKCKRDILTNAKELSTYMIEEFKKSDCYKAKTEEERNEIIKYLYDNPDEDEEEDFFSDGTDITIM